MRKKETEFPWQSIVIVEPPVRLDERVAGLIEFARMQRATTRRVVPLWVLVAACSACLMLGFMARQMMLDTPRTQGPPGVVVELSQEDLPLEFFVVEQWKNTSFFEKPMSELEIEFQPVGRETGL